MAANTTARKTPVRTTKAAAAKPMQPTEPVVDPTPADNDQPFAYLVDKAPTSLHENYAAWLQEQTGMELSERDIKMIQMVCVTRNAFQKSDANQSDLSARKQAWQAAQNTRAKQQEAAKKARLAKLAAELGVEIAAGATVEAKELRQAAKAV